MKKRGNTMDDIVKILIVVAICAVVFVVSLILIKSVGEKNVTTVSKESESKEESEDKAEVMREEQAPQSDGMDETEGEQEEEAGINEIADEPQAAKINEVTENAEPEEDDDDEYLSSDEQGQIKAMSEFDTSLVKFLEASGFEIENYMISPASFRAVIALAVAGADSETKAELLSAAGFGSEEEMNAWYKGLAGAPDTSGGGLTFKLLNSVWHNTRLKGTVSENYKKYIETNYQAKASDVSADKITQEVNKWVNEGTGGLIPQIANDLSAEDMVLVNTLYLKSTWVFKFDEYLTEEGDFKAFDECNIKKVFMEQTSRFNFYEDDDTKLVVLPMVGNVEAVFVIGNTDEIQDKLSQATREKVHVKIPKLDTITSLDSGQLVAFLEKRGVKSAFSHGADFTAMSKDSGFYISDVIQKTKILMDENGIEAAAASAITMLGSAPPSMNPEEPKEFIANEPFKFIIMTGKTNKEILFYGQIVE
ncbi:serpin family protein [Butyrivibrio sp. AE3004]|uniref:serpin family protein n=1 Tax=Butyrivibrio sp. AE3004 TaxID=1506994 RepID=UPI0004946FAB|nr:serpin family protein [Butyrivibrio sp. AE3004]